MARKLFKTERFKELTWDDLQEWAGSTTVARGRSYQGGHRVQELARTPAGGLVAWYRVRSDMRHRSISMRS
jgi:uncharacterized Zn finger protein